MIESGRYALVGVFAVLRARQAQLPEADGQDGAATLNHGRS